MLGSGSIIMLHELEAKGKSIRAISRETGLSRNTVRKYLRAVGIPKRKTHPRRGSKLDPYTDIIQQMIKSGIFNCEVIYELYRAMKRVPAGKPRWTGVNIHTLMRRPAKHISFMCLS